jgi:mannose-6-phosphate isomerase
MAEIKGEKPIKTDKPWGYELLFARTDKYAGKVLYVKQGHRLSLQYHQQKDETVYVYDGELRMEVKGEDGAMTSLVFKSGQCIRIKPGTRHRMEAIRCLEPGLILIHWPLLNTREVIAPSSPFTSIRNSPSYT